MDKDERVRSMQYVNGHTSSTTQNRKPVNHYCNVKIDV